MDDAGERSREDYSNRLSTLFSDADEIIDAGFDVFPAAVWVREDGTVAKAPLMRNGHLGAHRDRQLIRQQIINPPHQPLGVPDHHEVVVAFIPGSGGCGVLDCDVKHGKLGQQTLAELTKQYGSFYKAAWRSPSGGVNILFDKPPATAYGNASPWPGIDVRADNGWVVAPGNVCAAGAWQWKLGDFTTAAPLPSAMSDQLTAAGTHGRKASNADTVAFVEASPTTTTVPVMQAFDKELTRFRSSSIGSRHDALLRIVSWCCGMESLDLRWAIEKVKDEWLALTHSEGREDEVTDVLTWVVGQEVPKRNTSGANAGTTAAIVDYQVSDVPVIDGAAFILDQPTAIDARWGKGNDVLWSKGESLLLCGPTGVGKTTIAGQLVGALIGELPDVLGYPVLPAKRVLYLAMDRPRQVQRAFARLFTPAHRKALTERLAVRRGPLAGNIEDHPDILLNLALEHGVDVIIIDSLKDMGPLDDAKIGNKINTAIQLCNAQDIDVLALHHQRKGVEGKKPKTIEDVFGSTWITAGAGSVVLLWGEPGSEQVELSHLKQPAEVVGPLNIEHDHHRGTSTVTLGWDALAWLNGRGAAGGTVADAATAHHGSVQPPGTAKWKRTERRLRALVEAGQATKSGQTGVGTSVTYFPVIVVPTSPPGRGQPVDIPANDLFSPVDTP